MQQGIHSVSLVKPSTAVGISLRLVVVPLHVDLGDQGSACSDTTSIHRKWWWQTIPCIIRFCFYETRWSCAQRQDQSISPKRHRFEIHSFLRLSFDFAPLPRRNLLGGNAVTYHDDSLRASQLPSLHGGLVNYIIAHDVYEHGRNCLQFVVGVEVPRQQL